MLLLTNNQISRVQEGLHKSLPKLSALVLTRNHIATFEEIDRIACFANLKNLVLWGNPVTKRKYYREYVIFKCKHLEVLDFRKIKEKDRDDAYALFNSAVGKKALEDKEFVQVPQQLQYSAPKDKEFVQVPQHSAHKPPPPPAPVGILICPSD